MRDAYLGQMGRIKTIGLLCAVLFTFDTSAQVNADRFRPITITEPAVLVEAGDVRSNEAIWKAVKKSTFSRSQVKMMMWYGQKELRPKHLQDRFRDEEKPYFVNMRALELLVVGKHALIMIAGPENKHLPEEIRPIADLFVVVPTSAYQEAQPWDRLPEATDLMNGPSIKGLSKVKLADPDKIFGNFNLGTDQLAQETLKAMMGYRDVRHVNYRSNEKGWPKGMNSHAERRDLKTELSSYRAYSLMEFDGKRVLIIPACKNRKIRRNARPLADIYLIVKD